MLRNSKSYGARSESSTKRKRMAQGRREQGELRRLIKRKSTRIRGTSSGGRRNIKEGSSILLSAPHKAYTCHQMVMMGSQPCEEC
eukprot:scaffold98573_cov79-Attheya_sp.AAC.1